MSLPPEKALDLDKIVRWIDITGSQDEIEALYRYLKKKIKKMRSRSAGDYGFNGHLTSFEAEILTDIEKQVGKLPIVDDAYFSKGAVIDDGHIVEIGFCGYDLTEIPRRVNELFYLETLYIDVSKFSKLPLKIGHLHLSPFLSESVNNRVYWK